MRTQVIVVGYLAAIIAANLIIAAVGPAAAIGVAFVFIGLDLTARDVLHELWHGRPEPMLGLILTGGVLSWLVNRGAGQIAIASTVAFVLSGAADWLVYSGLHRHDRWLRVNGSNVVGAAVDSLTFPTLAFGALLPIVVLGQFVAKVAGGAIWYGVLRAVSVRQARA